MRYTRSKQKPQMKILKPRAQFLIKEKKWKKKKKRREGKSITCKEKKNPRKVYVLA